MAPKIGDVISWLRGGRREKIINLGDTVVRGSPGFVPSDFGNKGTSSQVSWGAGGVSDKKKKEKADRRAPGIDSESSIDTGATDQVLPGTADASPVKDEGVAGQVVTDISGESVIEEGSTDHVVPGVAGVSPVKEEGVAGQIVRDTKGKSLVGEWTSGKVSRKIDGVSLKAKWDPSEVSPSYAGIMAQIPMDKGIYKEGHMDGTHYVARNEGESSILRQLHPSCDIMIPSDYNAAIEEIRTCPLNCPYKALEFAELDQKTLRSRPKPPK